MSGYIEIESGASTFCIESGGITYTFEVERGVTVYIWLEDDGPMVRYAKDGRIHEAKLIKKGA